MGGMTVLVETKQVSKGWNYQQSKWGKTQTTRALGATCGASEAGQHARLRSLRVGPHGHSPVSEPPYS
jgi:hypothetical protein